MPNQPAGDDELAATKDILNTIHAEVRLATHSPLLRAQLVEGFSRGFGVQRALLSRGADGLTRDRATAILAEHGAKLRDDGQVAAFLGYTVASISLELYDYPADHPQAGRVEALRRQVAAIIALVGLEEENVRLEVIKSASRH